MSKQTSGNLTPTADNSQRIGGGNDPAAAGETHSSGKAERIGADKRFTLRTGGESQPTRGAGGNTPVTGEKHDSAKAERITEERRW